ncbi:hypothetical protein [Pseudomonas oryzae]|uniref:hypothetical protein n=1 Tax=Pseudomonas oryzae TaxID=1392877 RepID=UPI000A7D550F|nr:hypothetical protein [Pseudomonas oryzae]
MQGAPEGRLGYFTRLGSVFQTFPMPLPEIAINLFWHAKFNKDPANRWIQQLMLELFSASSAQKNH